MLFSASLSYFTRSAAMRSGCDTPAGFRSTWFTTLKIAVFAPIPSASAAMAVRLNAGLLAKVRNVIRRLDVMSMSSQVDTQPVRLKMHDLYTAAVRKGNEG